MWDALRESWTFQVGLLISVFIPSLASLRYICDNNIANGKTVWQRYNFFNNFLTKLLREEEWSPCITKSLLEYIVH